MTKFEVIFSDVSGGETFREVEAEGWHVEDGWVYFVGREAEPYPFSVREQFVHSVRPLKGALV